MAITKLAAPNRGRGVTAPRSRGRDSLFGPTARAGAAGSIAGKATQRAPGWHRLRRVPTCRCLSPPPPRMGPPRRLDHRRNRRRDLVLRNLVRTGPDLPDRRTGQRPGGPADRLCPLPELSDRNHVALAGHSRKVGPGHAGRRLARPRGFRGVGLGTRAFAGNRVVHTARRIHQPADDRLFLGAPRDA